MADKQKYFDHLNENWDHNVDAVIDLFSKRGDVESLLSLKTSLHLKIDDIIFALSKYNKLEEINTIYNSDKSTLLSIFISLAMFGHFDKIKHFYIISNSGKAELNIIACSAALKSHYDIVLWAIEKGADNIEQIICNFAYAGTLDIAKELLNIDIFSFNINKIANRAAQGGHKWLIDYLIENGADDYLYIARGAAMFGFFNIVEELDNKYHFQNRIPIAKYAAKGGYIDILKWSLDGFVKTADINEILHAAIAYRKINVIKWLIHNGYFEDFNYLAVNCDCDYRIVKLAIKYGANNFDEIMEYGIKNNKYEITTLARNKKASSYDEDYSLAKYVNLFCEYVIFCKLAAYNYSNLFISFIMCMYTAFSILKKYYNRKPLYKIYIEILTFLIMVVQMYIIYILYNIIYKIDVYIPVIFDSRIFTLKFLITVIVTPIVEEILFRCLVQIQIDKYINLIERNKYIADIISIFIGSLYFTLLHEEQYNIVPFSFLLVLMFRITKNGVLSCILLHMLNNYIMFQ